MSTDKQKRTIALWLYTCCATVFIMVIIGAITRLTESGLSMVEWRPLIGAFPPLNEQEWTRVFELYKQAPEFQKKNFWMGLSEFKTIFFWEWLHRFWGRSIGLIYALPLAFFWIKNWLPPKTHFKFIILLLLGASQGLLGWWMVKSGLIDQPAVSHHRLAAHLSMAFLLFCSLLWMGFSIDPKMNTKTNNAPFSPLLKPHLLIVLSSIILTIFWGAYVAGLDAGLIYNDTFPKMGDSWIPKDMWQYEPFWINFFETHAGVQFIHRWLAMGTLALILSFWLHAHKKNATHIGIHALAIMGIIQLILGILTLFSGINITLATLHQAGALTTLGISIFCLFKTYKN